MDEDSLRRGIPTVHKHFEKRLLKDHPEKIYEGRIFRKMSERFGVSMAILQGDILYALMERCFTQSPFGADPVREGLDIVHRAYRAMSEGQILDLLSELKRDGTERDYIRLIEDKTARLFSAAVEVGAVFGGATEPQIRALSRYANSLGTAFQLQDDLLDINPGLKGRAFGSDLRRGKFTLLVIKALETADSRQRRKLLAALGNDKAGRRAMQSAIEVLHAGGAVDYVKILARRKLNEARFSLESSGLSAEARAFFEGLSDSMARRKA
jgi:geranylgeranyl pyrophosphate synthase